MNENSKDPLAIKLSVIMEQIVRLCDRDDITLGELLHELSVYGHMLICLMFAVPFLLPVPLPGLSTIFGFVICVASIQIIFGFDPWVPATWRHKKLSTDILKKMFQAASRVLRYTEKVFRPRLRFFARHPGFVRVNGFVSLLMSLLLALPMPPGFNAPPALAIIILSISSLEHDGVMVVAGYILSLLNLVLFTTFFILGFDGLKAILGS